MERKDLILFLEQSHSILSRFQKKEVKDAFTISGYPHYENVISNWLAFFFDSTAEHGFKTLFGEAIKNVITSKDVNAEVDWLMYQSQTVREVQTKKGNFLDLVIYSNGDTGSNSYENCLLIEHKVYASLYNDLEDYYDSISAEEGKYAVLLSAKERNDKHSSFLNISYAELIREIKNLLGKYQLSAEHRYILYLTDLLANMDNLSSNTSNEDIDFCFNYGQELKDLASLKYITEGKLLEQVKISLSDSDFIYNKRYPYSFSIGTENNNISLVFSLDELFSKRESKFQFWLKDDLVQKWNQVNDIPEIIEFCNQKGFEACLKKEGKTWAEVCRGTFSLELKTSLNFGEQLKLFLEGDLKELVLLINKLTSNAQSTN
jgi:hypothetical protein